MVILLLFENLGILGRRYYLTYEEIKDATAIPDNEQRNLQSLACTKSKVLRKHHLEGSQPRAFVLVQRRFLNPIIKNQN